MYRQAAEVIDSVKRHVDMTFFLDKAQHLDGMAGRKKGHRGAFSICGNLPTLLPNQR
jgi:hypothetical protein